jgi:hypothetical protein
MFRPATLEAALHALGEVLEARELTYDVVTVGGSSLMLLGLLERPTRDLDLVALIESGRYVKANPLPAPLAEAAVDVGETLGIGRKWLNAGPTDLLDFGLPPGFADRVETRRYAALTLRLASRLDQICLKLYAVVDQGLRSKHFEDIVRLTPSADELLYAGRWSITHDPSEGFRSELVRALALLGVADAGTRL